MTGVDRINIFGSIAGQQRWAGKYHHCRRRALLEHFLFFFKIIFWRFLWLRSDRRGGGHAAKGLRSDLNRGRCQGLQTAYQKHWFKNNLYLSYSLSSWCTAKSTFFYLNSGYLPILIQYLCSLLTTFEISIHCVEFSGIKSMRPRIAVVPNTYMQRNW